MFRCPHKRPFNQYRDTDDEKTGLFGLQGAYVYKMDV